MTDGAGSSMPSFERPKLQPVRLLVAWLLSAAALLVAAWLLPGLAIEGGGGALLAALLIAVLNAVLPPLVAALRLPFTLVLGFLLVLLVDAAMFVLAAEIAPGRDLGRLLVVAARGGARRLGGRRSSST